MTGSVPEFCLRPTFACKAAQPMLTAHLHLRVPSDPLSPPHPFPAPEPIPTPAREPAPDGPENPDVPVPGPDPIEPSQI